MTVADMAGEIVILDHLPPVAQDLGRRRDRRPGPRLEAVAKRVQIAVGADPGITVGPPRAAESLLRFEHDKARPRALLRQVIGAANPGNPGTDNQDIEMLAAGRAHRPSFDRNAPAYP